MTKSDSNLAPASRFSGILSDVHFWVPLLVLIGGLLLLRFMH
jgi:hypothetical protein